MVPAHTANMSYGVLQESGPTRPDNFGMALGTLRYGMESAGVLRLQKRLKRLGYFDGPTTGYFGTITRGAVSSFEKARGLERDGVADPAMRAKLKTFAQTKKALRDGETGDKVLRLQKRLKKAGYFEGRATGTFDASTRAAVSSFEKAKGLRQDGVADYHMRELLAAAVKKPEAAVDGDWKTAPKPPSDYRRVTSHGVVMNVRTRTMVERAERYLKAQGIDVTFQMSQGSYDNRNKGSGGTHDRGGALDIRIVMYSTATADKMVKALRQAGFAAWRRGVGDGFGPHIHAIAIGDREASSAAKSQVQAYFAGRNGLKNNGRDIHLTSVGHNVGRPVPNWAKQ